MLTSSLSLKVVQRGFGERAELGGLLRSPGKIWNFAAAEASEGDGDALRWRTRLYTPAFTASAVFLGAVLE